MARIQSVEGTPEDPRVAELFAEVESRGWKVPNLYRALAASPTLLGAWIDFAWSVRLDPKTPRGLRELVILRAAQVAGVAYEWAHHRKMALDAGASEAQLAALADWREGGGDVFTPAERAALAMAEETTRGPGATVGTIEALKRHFTDEEVVELVLTASFYACVGRVLTSLGVVLEPGYDAELKGFAD